MSLTREYKAERMRRWRASQKAQGRCQRCSLVSVKGETLCLGHKRSEARRKNYQWSLDINPTL